jgi:glutamyl-tRNA synthetase
MHARLAPSPTGALHVGNARTFLIAWLDARSRGQRLSLRIEDIDSPRVKPGTTAALLADLRALGLDWDGEPIVQTERLTHYAAALEQLKARELVYPCTCTRSDIEQAASAPHASHEPTYPGTCAGRSVADAAALAAAGRPFAWRFRVTHSPTFTDRFVGPVALDLHDHGGDFVVWKSAQTPAYQLAVVVDDAAQQISDVVRGDDLIPSTPRQLLLYAALGLPAPRFAHVPLVVGPDGRRLAKRHGDTRLASLWAAGITPAALVGLLAFSCGWRERIAPATPRELLADYRLEAIPPRPFVLTPDLLDQLKRMPG